MATERYVLGTKFSMPMDNGEVVKAVAVTSSQGKILQSLYTLMLQTIVLEIWTLVVLAGMALVLKKPSLTHNMNITNIAVWNLQSSPLTVAKAMMEYIPYVPGYALLWMVLAISTIAASVLISTFVTPFLIAGQAAPANPAAIFIPWVVEGPQPVVILNRLRSPPSMRALSALDAIDTATSGLNNQAENSVYFHWQAIPSALPDATIYQFNWSYSVSGTAFGLQYASELLHTAQGSCITEYSWYKPNGSEIYQYKLANDTPKTVIPDLNGSTMLLTPYVSKISTNRSDTTVPFAILVSSARRRTYTKSDDPWYLTGDTPVVQNSSGSPLYAVQDGRPMLSCWQSDTWAYGGKTRSIRQISDLEVIPPALVNVLQYSHQIPRIVTLTQNVGPLGLKSSFGMLGRTFDASNASIVDDMKRLVLGEYVATKNVFLDATLFETKSSSKVENYALFNTNMTDPAEAGAGDFVIYGSEFVALRINMLIAVPVVLVQLFILVVLLGDSYWIPWPWRKVHALSATVLFNNIDSFTHKESHHDAVTPVAPPPLRETDGEIVVRPKWDRHSSSYSWQRVPTQYVNSQTSGHASHTS